MDKVFGHSVPPVRAVARERLAVRAVLRHVDVILVEEVVQFVNGVEEWPCSSSSRSDDGEERQGLLAQQPRRRDAPLGSFSAQVVPMTWKLGARTFGFVTLW